MQITVKQTGWMRHTGKSVIQGYSCIPIIEETAIYYPLSITLFLLGGCKLKVIAKLAKTMYAY